MENIHERKVVFKALFGSHNYNLNSEYSDKDYKFFVMPTFDDVYFGKYFSTSFVSESMDYDVHDIRKLPELFFKSNINFLEVLFSQDIRSTYLYNDFMQYLVKNRENFARMNLPYLYNACIGMSLQKQKRMTGKGTESTKALVEEFGFDCKEATHAIRVLDFIERYALNKFNSFHNAIYYENNENMREVLLKVKFGKFSLAEVKLIIEHKMENALILEGYYLNKPVEKLLYDNLTNEIKLLVRENVLNGN